MNANTRDALMDFVFNVRFLAFEVKEVCGEQTVKDIMESARKLERALTSDETIIED